MRLSSSEVIAVGREMRQAKIEQTKVAYALVIYLRDVCTLVHFFVRARVARCIFYAFAGKNVREIIARRIFRVRYSIDNTLMNICE